MWYRHRQTGDRGKRETRDGKEVVVYDRPGADMVVPYSENEWKEDAATRQYSLMELGRVAWVADQELSSLMGISSSGRKWSELTDRARMRWVVKGPSGAIEREALFDAIMEVMRPIGSPLT